MPPIPRLNGVADASANTESDLPVTPPAAVSTLNGAARQSAAHADPRPPITEDADDLCRRPALRLLGSQVQVTEAHGDQLLQGEIAPVPPFVAPLLARRVSRGPVQLHGWPAA